MFFLVEKDQLSFQNQSKAFEMPGSLFKPCNFIKVNVPLK